MPHQSYIERVYVEVVPDEDPDLSHLEQTYDDVTDPIARESYLEQDRARLESYRRGDWSMVGVRAVAEITIDREGLHVEPVVLKSAGLWGIESDSGRDYGLEVGGEELNGLCDQLEAMRYSTSEIDHALGGEIEFVDSVGLTEPKPGLVGLESAPSRPVPPAPPAALAHEIP